MKQQIVALAIAMALLAIGCNSRTNMDGLERPDEAQNYGAVTVDSTVTGGDYAGDQQQKKGEEQMKMNQPPPNIDWDKKIIKTGTLQIEAEDYKKYYALVKETVAKSGGYIASEDQEITEYKLENVVTIKVPIAQFENAMQMLTAGNGKEKLIERRIGSQDVTGEVIDTKSRTEAKRQVRQRYLDLLKQARNMEDILKVQQEINEIQEEIEMGMGRVNYLSHSAAFSTIELTFFQVVNPSAVQPSQPTFFTRLWAAMDQGWDFTKNVIIGVIALWPLWLAACFGWILIRRFRPVMKTKPLE